MDTSMNVIEQRAKQIAEAVSWLRVPKSHPDRETVRKLVSLEVISGLDAGKPPGTVGV